MTDYVPTNYQKKAFRVVEKDGKYSLELTSQPFPIKRLDKGFQYSIAKWIVICELLEQGINLTEDGGEYTCALCKMTGWANCRRCPVYMYTGKKQCHSTPYYLVGWSFPIDRRLTGVQAEIAFLQKVYRWWMMRGQ